MSAPVIEEVLPALMDFLMDDVLVGHQILFDYSFLKKAAVNQGISALVLIISGIYTVSQNISGLEIEVGKGGMTSAQALEKANAFTAQVQPRQTLLLRIGMVVIPVLALTCAYVLIRKKYKITEEAYQKMVAEIVAR